MKNVQKKFTFSINLKKLDVHSWKINKLLGKVIHLPLYLSIHRKIIAQRHQICSSGNSKQNIHSTLPTNSATCLFT